MPFYPVLIQLGSPHRVLFWTENSRDACFGVAECPQPELCPRREDAKEQRCFWCLHEQCPNTTSPEHEKFLVYATRYVTTGSFPPNRQKFKQIEGTKLYSLKPSEQLRLIGAFREKAFIIIACCRKKRGDYPKGVLRQWEKLWDASRTEQLIVR